MMGIIDGIIGEEGKGARTYDQGKSYSQILIKATRGEALKSGGCRASPISRRKVGRAN